MALNPEAAKQSLGVYAAGQVQAGTALGIGSGTTVDAFIDALGARFRRERFSLACVAASESSAARARAVGLPVQPPEAVEHLDLAVDGADQVNPAGVLIKGGGAALVRERLVMSQARQALILVDSRKLRAQFEAVTVPVAVLPFAWPATLARIKQWCPEAELRRDHGQPVVTDDGLYLVDAPVERLSNPAARHAWLKMLPGVVDTGIFAGFSVDVRVSDGLTVWRMASDQP
jgi:ribose 5-phosphate isomerase A